MLLARCMIRDVAVKVPEPDDFIAESVFPSHIIVPRCSGISLIRTLHRRRTPANKKGHWICEYTYCNIFVWVKIV